MKAILNRMLQSLVFILVSVWVLLSIMIYFFQPSFIYYPHKDVKITPSQISLNHEDLFLTTKDGLKINAWWIPHKNARANLLFLHGNAGNISHRLDSIKIFHELGLSILIIDYRGYGKSEGKPSEKGTYHDAEAAWNYMINDLKIKEDDIIIFGRSLGGAVATWLATNQQAAGLIIESTFTSIVDMGKQFYPYLPVSLLTRIKYPSIDMIDKIDMPLLSIHSRSDEIVPYRFGKRLFEKANEPKMFLDISGGHNEGFLSSGKQYTDGLEQFIHNHLNK